MKFVSLDIFTLESVSWSKYFRNPEDQILGDCSTQLSDMWTPALLLPNSSFHSREAPLSAMHREEGSRSCGKPVGVELHKQSPKKILRKALGHGQGALDFRGGRYHCRCSRACTWPGFGCLPAASSGAIRTWSHAGITKSPSWQWLCSSW